MDAVRSGMARSSAQSEAERLKARAAPASRVMRAVGINKANRTKHRISVASRSHDREPATTSQADTAITTMLTASIRHVPPGGADPTERKRLIVPQPSFTKHVLPSSNTRGLNYGITATVSPWQSRSYCA